MTSLHTRGATLAGVLLCAITVSAQAPAPSRAAANEAATARRFTAIRTDPLRLRAFLRDMPKGGDLHNHLSGSIYAESYLRWAAEDKLCLATATMSIVAGTCDAAAGQPPVADVLRNARLYNRAVDAMSMRNWNGAVTGHDQFFDSFGKFGPSSGRMGDMLAEVASRAANENVSYMELMLTPAGTAATRFAREAGWNPDLAQLRDRMLAAGFRDAVIAEARQRLDAGETRARELMQCTGAPPQNPGCGVTLRFIAQVSRASAPEIVFAQMLAGFELAGAEPRVVSLNLVQPEDDPNAVANFTLQMQMLDFLHGHYPKVPITLHAGELTEGLVPPEVLRFHIRQSIEKGHAVRIGHGAAVIHEDDPFGLLRQMAAKKVLVEIALSSNDGILGVSGTRHPLKLYLQHGVPVAIVTDDMGVSRSTHTDEFLRAVQDQGLDYATLKRMARNSIAHAFADGPTKKQLQGSLERAFHAFERRQASEPRAASPKPRTP